MNYAAFLYLHIVISCREHAYCFTGRHLVAKGIESLLAKAARDGLRPARIGPILHKPAIGRFPQKTPFKFGLFIRYFAVKNRKLNLRGC